MTLKDHNLNQIGMELLGEHMVVNPKTVFSMTVSLDENYLVQTEKHIQKLEAMIKNMKTCIAFSRVCIAAGAEYADE